MSKPYVFISHPFASNPEKNMAFVDVICRDLIEQNAVVPISPLHLFSAYEEDNDREEILNYCEHMIMAVDMVMFFEYSDGLSEGQKFELKVAQRNGKQVMIISVGDDSGS